jgi:hypothetical protein
MAGIIGGTVACANRCLVRNGGTCTRICVTLYYKRIVAERRRRA